VCVRICSRILFSAQRKTKKQKNRISNARNNNNDSAHLISEVCFNTFRRSVPKSDFHTMNPFYDTNRKTRREHARHYYKIYTHTYIYNVFIDALYREIATIIARVNVSFSFLKRNHVIVCKTFYSYLHDIIARRCLSRVTLTRALNPRTIIISTQLYKFNYTTTTGLPMCVYIYIHIRAC